MNCYYSLKIVELISEVINYHSLTGNLYMCVRVCVDVAEDAQNLKWFLVGTVFDESFFFEFIKFTQLYGC
jgi:hypothetical protein